MTIALEGSPQELLVPRLPYLCMHKQNFVIVHTLKPLNSNSILARLDTKWQLEQTPFLILPWFRWVQWCYEKILILIRTRSILSCEIFCDEVLQTNKRWAGVWNWSLLLANWLSFVYTTDGSKHPTSYLFLNNHPKRQNSPDIPPIATVKPGQVSNSVVVPLAYEFIKSYFVDIQIWMCGWVWQLDGSADWCSLTRFCYLDWTGAQIGNNS